jgi:hypothetical protein
LRASAWLCSVTRADHLCAFFLVLVGFEGMEVSLLVQKRRTHGDSGMLPVLEWLKLVL